MIREAEFDDVPSIAQASYITWPHTYREIISDSKIDSRNLDAIKETGTQVQGQGVGRKIDL